MKYYIVVGEASGDLLGSNLMKAIISNDNEAEFRYWGGDRMKAVGGTLVRHYKDHDFMGIVEVAKHLPTILGNMSFCVEDIKEYKPDCVIFIDFPGFNLKVAKKIKDINATIFYYVSPTIWAWKENRVNIVKKYVDRMFVILPFEKSFYKDRHNVDVDFFGHPLLDQIAATPEKTTRDEFLQQNQLPDKDIIAVLPGSREAEIRENLRTMQEIADDFSDYTFVIAGMSRFPKEKYMQYISKQNVKVIFDQTYDLLRKAKAAIVVSGTATLETALIGTPEMLVYKTSQITWSIGSLFVDLKYLGLPNLILDRSVIPEVLQKEMTGANIKKQLELLLFDEETKKRTQQKYADLREALGGGGASERVGKAMVDYLRRDDRSIYYRNMYK